MSSSESTEIPQESARRQQLLVYIDRSIAGHDAAKVLIHHIPVEHVQDTIDTLWDLLEDQTNPQIGIETKRELPARSLRRLLVRLATIYDAFPTYFFLKGVMDDGKYIGLGGTLGDMYRGSWKGRTVALRHLRDEIASSAEKRRSYYLNALTWHHLNHQHILPMHGMMKSKRISLFGEKEFVCGIIPWLSRGNIRDHLAHLRSEHTLTGHAFVKAVNRWLYQVSLGLLYLHREAIVHGDVHASNVLIDDEGNARLTDLGSEPLVPHIVTGQHRKYGSGGCSYACKSPERIYPEEFGLEEHREPTFACDVYSFAMLCVELYNEQQPFGEVDGLAIMREVMTRKRLPPRPVTRDLLQMSDCLYDLVQRCWTRQPGDRPSMETVTQELKAIVDAEEKSVVPDSLRCVTIRLDDLLIESTSYRMDTALISRLTQSQGQDFIDNNWKRLQSPNDNLPTEVLWQLILKLSEKFLIVPTSLLVNDVTREKSALKKQSEPLSILTTTFCGHLNQQLVAVKQLKMISTKFAKARRDQTKQELIHEFLRWNRLEDPHVLPFTGMADEESLGNIHLIQPWMINGSVSELIDRLRDLKRLQGQPLGHVLNYWLLQAAVGLQYLHSEHVVHGNIHAGNILIDLNGNAKLSDFGVNFLAFKLRCANGGGSWSKSALRWAAPELVKGDSTLPAITEQSDIYSFGRTGIEMYGRAFLGAGWQTRWGPLRERPVSLEGDVISNEVWTLFLRCISNDPLKRPVATEVVESLKPVQTDLPPLASTLPPPESLFPDGVIAKIPCHSSFSEESQLIQTNVDGKHESRGRVRSLVRSLRSRLPAGLRSP